MTEIMSQLTFCFLELTYLGNTNLNFTRMGELKSIFEEIEFNENYCHAFMVSGYAFHWTVLLVNKVRGKLELISVDPVSYNQLSFSPMILSKVLHQKLSFEQFYLDSLVEQTISNFQMFALQSLSQSKEAFAANSCGANWFQSFRSLILRLKPSGGSALMEQSKTLLLHLVSHILGRAISLKGNEALKDASSYYAYCAAKIRSAFKSEKVLRKVICGNEDVAHERLFEYILPEGKLSERFHPLCVKRNKTLFLVLCR